MSEHSENLFLFEFLVENVRLERPGKVSDRLALGVRLLDFPTLLIYQPDDLSSRNTVHTEQEGKDKPGEYIFNRGKSCFFKMSLQSLHIQFSNTPLYAMLLDVTEESPRLVGSSLTSLAKVVDRIKQEGTSSPSSHRERGLASLCNLAGERIGAISLSYKLVCLGASLLPHITEERGFKSTRLPGGQQQEHVKEENKSSLSFPLENASSPTMDKSELNVRSDEQTDLKILLDEDKLDDGAACCSAESQNENHCEEDLTAFCPPRLYFSNTTQERSRNEKVDYKLLNLDLEAFTFEESCSEEEKDETPGCHQKVAFTSNVSSHQEASGVTPNILREALKQLPLLNALVAELSLLTDSVQPSQAGIYRPELTDIHLKHPRNCSTPIINPAKIKDSQEEAITGNKSSSKPHRKKLVFGTTKTFNLRLKQVSPLKVKHRECMGLIQKETQLRTVAGKTKSSRKAVKSSKRKSLLNQSHSLNENIETVMQSVTADSALRAERNAHERGFSAEDFGPQTELKYFHLPRVDGDSIPPGKDEHQSKSDQSESEFDGHKFKFLLPRVKEKLNSRHSSSLESSMNGNQDVDYADDFDSLESSDASLSKPGSPESSRTKTKSPVCPDSRSDEMKPVPAPVKAPSSPRRALKGTHIIRPRTPSSEGDNGDGSASLQTVCSRKQVTAGDRVERRSGAASFLSSRGERTESPGDYDSVRGFSDKSISSFEAQEAEELEDELGSLDFRKKYQHISELVARKLPGYTM
ncbi:microtubule-associated protein 10 [Kryptolebias marmoratus]|uniref:microtubule-associated protein 10 n=1 Tax=Kryptolebias marmoratus TaxID=37003 RepID=UPI0007F8D0F3|nr:microtubule-associated protein 10 [Kryptolebias marmoratus]